ncbi:MAG: SMI1/KNR4 family protein [Candidatus Limnocylindrales bacterium]
MAEPVLADPTFLTWLRAATETRWADTGLRDAATAGLGGPAWQPGTRWRGGMSESDIDIVEAMFGVRLPSAYREFLRTLHTPDPPLAALAVRGGRLVRVEARLFPDWTGPTTPLLTAFEAPLEGLLRGVALGRWHPAWGERPDDARDRIRRVRALAAAAPRLIPFAGERYLAAVPGRDDGPVFAVHGADMALMAPDLRRGLLRELGLGDSGDPDLGDAASTAVERIPFWSDVADGLPWRPPGVIAEA